MSVHGRAETEGGTRRGFYIGVMNAIGAVIGAMLGIPAAIYLLVPPKLKKESDWVEAADVTALAVNQPVEVVFRRNRADGWKIVSEKDTAWVVKSADNRVTAFAPQCTHLGCAYHWDERRSEFVCPCHSSLFSIDGQVLSGPAPRPLDRYAARIEGGKLLLGAIQKSPERPA